MTGGALNKAVCTINIFATALETTLEKYMNGGTGYITLEFKKHDSDKKSTYHGFSNNETDKLHCYYMTNKNFGSEFLDNPKTLSMAITCPVSIDNEIGTYSFNSRMIEGYYCRVLSEKETQISVHLRPTSFRVPLDYAQHNVR